MDSSKVLGILIIVALIASVGVVGVNSIILNNNQASGNSHSIILGIDALENASMMNNEETNSSDLYIQLNNSTNVKPVINMNIHQKAGVVNVEFADTDSIYNITSSNYNNSSTTVKYEQSNETFNVDVSSNSAENTIVLSNKYDYNINGEMMAGIFNTTLTPESKVNSMSVNITLGYLRMKLNNARVNSISTDITTGVANFEGITSGYTHIDSDIKVGLMNLKENQGKVYVRSDIPLGAENAPGYQDIKKGGYDLLKGSQFDASNEKLDITSHVQVGGLNIM